jgi:hypothetical protein
LAAPPLTQDGKAGNKENLMVIKEYHVRIIK